MLLGSCIGLPGLPLIGLALNVPLSRLERDSISPIEGDKRAGSLAKLSDVRTDRRIVQGTHGNSFNAPSLT